MTAEHERSILLKADAGHVFRYLSKLQNLPKFVPTLRKVTSAGDGRASIEGEMDGQTYMAEGYLRQDRERRRMEWGSDEGEYFGWLEVREEEEGSELTVHVETHVTRSQPVDTLSPERMLEEGVARALGALKDFVETREVHAVKSVRV